MLAAINGFLKVVPPILLAAAILFLSLTVITQTARLSGALKASATHESNAANAVAANAQQTKLIAEFKQANKVCVGQWQKADAARQDSARSLADFKSKIKLESKLAAANEEALKNEACQTLLQTDISSRCPALASSLRRREALYYKD